MGEPPVEKVAKLAGYWCLDVVPTVDLPRHVRQFIVTTIFWLIVMSQIIFGRTGFNVKFYFDRYHPDISGHTLLFKFRKP